MYCILKKAFPWKLFRLGAKKTTHRNKERKVLFSINLCMIIVLIFMFSEYQHCTLLRYLCVESLQHLNEKKSKRKILPDFRFIIKDKLTAGNAKKLIPSNAQNDAIIFPCHVSGTISP